MERHQVEKALLFMGLGGFIVYMIFFIEPDFSKNPRLKNGIDKVETKDSVYLIHFDIIKVQKRKRQSGEPDDGF